jgi:hypothetical protein
MIFHNCIKVDWLTIESALVILNREVLTASNSSPTRFTLSAGLDFVGGVAESPPEAERQLVGQDIGERTKGAIASAIPPRG